MSERAKVLNEVYEALPEPEDHATASRDYGRGFSDAIRLVKQALNRLDLDEETS